MFKFTYARLFYSWIKSKLGQTIHTNIFPRVSIHYVATNLKAGSALGEKGKKKSTWANNNNNNNNKNGQRSKPFFPGYAATGCESRV